MIGRRTGRHRSFPGVARSLPRRRSSRLGRPTRSRSSGSSRFGAIAQTAVEMSAPWKPQNGFHRALEISHRTRDSHIPTADHFLVSQDDDDEEKERHTSRMTARQMTAS